MKDVTFLCGALKRVFQLLFVLTPLKLLFLYGIAVAHFSKIAKVGRDASIDTNAVVVQSGIELKNLPFKDISGAYLHFGIDILPALALMGVYYWVAKVFSLYQQKKMFSAEITHLYRKMAGVLFGYFVLQVAALLLHSAFSYQFAEQSFFSINLNHIDFLNVLFAGTAYVMAKMSDEAKNMAELNAYTI